MLLFSCSQGCLRQQFFRGTNGNLHSRDTHDETFRRLVQWFYTQRLDSLLIDDRFDPKSAEFEDKADAQ